MREMTCIICPKGCRLHIDEQLKVTGNGCERGAEYAREEVTAPVRTVTSTVRIEGGAHRRLPVKTSRPIPKDSMQEAVRLLDGVTVRTPIRCGEVVLADILGTGVDFIATRDL